MPRPLLATDHPFDLLTSLKFSFAAATFFATLLTGVSSYKLLKWRGEKWILIASRFAAGVFLGTAMIECLGESDIVFHNMGFRYPVALLMMCSGYLVAMLVECVLAGVVHTLGQGGFTKSYFKKLGNSKLIISLHATLSVRISESETKVCNDIGYHQNRILNKATQLGNGLFLMYILSVFSMMGGALIGLAETETNAWKSFLSAMFHNIIHIISLISLLLKSSANILITECLFVVIGFSILSPAGVILTFVLTNNDSMAVNHESVLVDVVNGLQNETVNEWINGILMGCCPGVLVYLLAHHQLVDRHEMNGAVPETHFAKFLAVVIGVGSVAVVKTLDV